jgi:hypothetical protein
MFTGMRDSLNAGPFQQPNDIKPSPGDLVEFYRGLSLKLITI